MTRLGRLAAAGLGLMMVACLLRQVEAPRPLRPATVACRPALQLDGQLVCGEPSLAALRALCPEAELAEGDAVTSTGGCRRGRMPGSELLALGVKIDVNSASADELEALPGIGPTLARRIVEARPYQSVADLDRVPGVGVARLAGMREHVRVSATDVRHAAP